MAPFDRTTRSEALLAPISVGAVVGTLFLSWTLDV